MKKIIKLTKKFVEYKTVFDNQKEIEKCFSYIKEKFSTNFEIIDYYFKDRQSMVLSNTKSKNLDVIFCGHIDVAPASKKLFSLYDNGKKIYGRGVFDMKGPLAATLLAVEKSLKKTKKKIAIFITADEEVDGKSTEYLLQQGYQSKFAILPDGGDDFNIVVGQKGFIQLKVDVQGEGAHAAFPWQTDNPIELSFLIFKRIKKAFPAPKNANDWKTSVSITKINSGESINKTPNVASFYLDIRYADKSDIKKVMDVIKKTAKNKCKINTIAKNDMFFSDVKNENIIKLKNLINKEAAYTKFIKTCSTSDAIFFANKKIPAVLFRPKGGDQHSESEWINKKSLKQFFDVIYLFLANKQFCNEKSTQK